MEDTEEAWIGHSVLNGKCDTVLCGDCKDLTKTGDSHVDLDRCFEAVKRIALAAGEVLQDAMEFIKYHSQELAVLDLSTALCHVDC